MGSISSVSLGFPILSSLLFLLTIGKAQQSETPHGLAFENPISLSPSAYDFFHPKHTVPPAGKGNAVPCAGETECAHLAALSASSKARADPRLDSGGSVLASGRGGTGAGNAVAIVMGLAFVMLVAMGAWCVLVKRRANGRKSNPIIQLHA